MNTQEIANRLVELCNRGEYSTAHAELYADNVISAEPTDTPETWASGIEAVREKGAQWGASLVEMHSMEISAPVVAGNHIALSMSIDATYKERGRAQMNEICVYETNDGKIVKEQFFYPMPPAQ